MSQPENKLDKFSSAVLQDAEENRQKILREIDEYRKSELEKAEEEVLREAYVLIQSEIADVKNKHSRQISIAELEGRRKLLLEREELTDKVFAEAADRLRTFVASEGYLSFLCEVVKLHGEKLPKGKLLIEVRSDDLQYSSALSAAGSREAEVKANPAIRIGGVVVSCPSCGLVIDETLDSRLNGQREWFTSQAGLSIGM